MSQEKQFDKWCLTAEKIEAFRKEWNIPGEDLEPWAIDENKVVHAMCDIALASVRPHVATNAEGPTATITPATNIAGMATNAARPRPDSIASEPEVISGGTSGAVAAPSTTPQKSGSATPRMDATLGKGADWVFAEGCKLERELAVSFKRFDDLQAHYSNELTKLEGASAASATPLFARPVSEWHDDMGNVIWWRIPVEEPPWVGTPLDSDWPLDPTLDEPVRPYYTHFTPLVIPANARADGTTKTIYVNGTQHSVSKERLHYEEVVRMAGHDPKRVLTVTYLGQRSGCMEIGCNPVAVEDGMRFSVANTSGA